MIVSELKKGLTLASKQNKENILRVVSISQTPVLTDTAVVVAEVNQKTNRILTKTKRAMKADSLRRRYSVA